MYFPNALLLQAATDVTARVTALEAATKSAQSAGDNAWMLTSAALVLMMTGPGLALFYGGLVRRKNVLSTMMHSFVMMGLITVIWAIAGYSLVFSEGSPFIGGLKYLFLNGVGKEPNADYAATIPQGTFMIYQLMFAVITPALISGAIAERMKFSGLLLFMTLWLLIVYLPMAHMVWGKNGFLGATWGHDLSDTLFGLPFPMTWHLGVQWFNEQGFQPDALGLTGFVKANYRMRVPWTKKHIDMGLGEGLSYVDRIPMSEQRDFAKKGPDVHSEKLMNYLEWTIDLPLRQFQSLDPLFRGGIEDMSVGFIVWHRSSVFGVFADTKGGVNFMGFGFEARF